MMLTRLNYGGLAVSFILLCFSFSVQAQDVPLTEVDVLVLYTDATENSIKSEGRSLPLRIQYYIDGTNNIFQTSGIPIDFKLVHAEKVIGFSRRDDSVLLNWMEKEENVFKDIGKLRKKYGADYVMLFRAGNAAKGNFNKAPFRPNENVFIVGNERHYYIMAHELGHNMGLQHSQRQDRTRIGITPYAWGYGVDKTSTENGFVTVMAYSSEFASAQKMLVFSSPDLECNTGTRVSACGIAPGIPGEADAVKTLSDRVELYAAVTKRVDHFPGIEAAAIDEDGDGYPDQWRLGCDVDCQRASGLSLDRVPGSAAAYLDEDLDGLPDRWAPGCNLQCQRNSGLVLDSRLNDTDNDGLRNIYDRDDNNDGQRDADWDGNGLIEISNIEELNAMRFDLSGGSLMLSLNGSRNVDGCPVIVEIGREVRRCHGYELVANIDFDTNGDGILNENDRFWNNGAGWEPIGRLSNPFVSKFYGNGFRINNLMINRFDSVVGLFGSIIGSSIVELNLRGPLMSIRGESYVGAIAGTMDDSEILACQVNGSIKGDVFAGGFAGRITNTSSITASLFSGEVESMFSGGLVGQIGSLSVIKGSLVIAQVETSGRAGALFSIDTFGEEHLTENNYWAIEYSGEGDGESGGVDTLDELRCPTAANNDTCSSIPLYAGWEKYVNDRGIPYWDFGDTTQLPALRFWGNVARDNDGDGIIDSVGGTLSKGREEWSTTVNISRTGSNGADLSMSVAGIGPLSSSDYLYLYSKVDDGPSEFITSYSGDFPTETLDFNVSRGNTVEITMVGNVAEADASYMVSDISVNTREFDTGATITNEVFNWDTGEIDISGAGSDGVNVSMSVVANGEFNTSGFLYIYYILDRGPLKSFTSYANNFSADTLNLNVSGNTLEIILEGATYSDSDSYTVSNISVEPVVDTDELGLVISDNGSVDSVDEKSFHSADSGPWIFDRRYPAIANTENKKEGAASMESVGGHVDRFAINLTDPVDASGSRFLQFWYYIDDVTKIRTDKDAQIEISSSSSYDTEELNWSLHSLDLQNGWNPIVLDLLEGKNRSKTNVDIDFTRLSRFRIYHFNSGPITTRIDGVRFSGEANF